MAPVQGQYHAASTLNLLVPLTAEPFPSLVPILRNLVPRNTAALGGEHAARALASSISAQTQIIYLDDCRGVAFRLQLRRKATQDRPMLRITVQETPQELILKLEGSLICSWSRSWKTNWRISQNATLPFCVT